MVAAFETKSEDRTFFSQTFYLNEPEKICIVDTSKIKKLFKFQRAKDRIYWNLENCLTITEFLNYLFHKNSR